MKKWEYKVEEIRQYQFGRLNKSLEKILNEYGVEGYELVSVSSNDIHIFKKPLQ